MAEMQARTHTHTPPRPKPAVLLHLAIERARSQELEFVIHPDGRVEERVRGIKGNNCQAVTAQIEEALGEVTDMKPTNEMFEQKVEVEVEETVKQAWGQTSWGEGGDSTGEAET